MTAKSIIIKVLPVVVFFYPANKVCQAFRIAPGADVSAKVLNVSDGFAEAFAYPLPSFHSVDLIAGLVFVGFILLLLQMKKENAKKFRKGIEYGSARWGTAADIKPFIDPVFANNVLLTRTERLTMENRPKNPAHARNKNVVCIGGSGSGKTRFFVKPNLMQMHSSYVVTDPKQIVFVRS